MCHIGIPGKNVTRSYKLLALYALKRNPILGERSSSYNAITKGVSMINFSEQMKERNAKKT